MSDDVAPAEPTAAPAGPVGAPEPGHQGGEGNPSLPTGGELDISSLPSEAQEYIRELREEAKGRRKEHEPYKKAFQYFNEAEQQYLLNTVEQLGTDQDAGATTMLNLAQRILGIEAAGAEIEADPEIQEEAREAGLNETQIREMVRREMEQEQMIAGVEEETRALGFEPGSPEASKLWDMAVALEEPDLSKVAPLVRQALGLPDPAAQAAPAEAAPEPQPEPASQFPRTPTANTGNGGTNAEERKPPPSIKSDEMRERVRRRIEAAAGQ